MQLAGEPFEIAQGLQTGDTQTAVCDGAGRRIDTDGVADDIRRGDHSVRETGLPGGRQTVLQRSRHGGAIDPEVVEIESHGVYFPSRV